MDILNRYIDRPLLDAASRLLTAWHNHSGLAPARLEPLWCITVLLFMLMGSLHVLQGEVLVLCICGIALLIVPSIFKLVSPSTEADYGVREYRSRLKRALVKREGEWAMRLTVLVVAALLPFFSSPHQDPQTTWFMFGASLWFVLTGPIGLYLEAAEPPKPRDGDPTYNASMQFG